MYYIVHLLHSCLYTGVLKRSDTKLMLVVLLTLVICYAVLCSWLTDWLVRRFACTPLWMCMVSVTALSSISIVIWVKSNQFSYTVARARLASLRHSTVAGAFTQNAHRCESTKCVCTYSVSRESENTFPIFLNSITQFKMNFSRSLSSSFELFATETASKGETKNINNNKIQTEN